MSLVFDSSALLAVVFREDGAEAAEQRLSGGLVSAVNASEVIARLVDFGTSGEDARNALLNCSARRCSARPRGRGRTGGSGWWMRFREPRWLRAWRRLVYAGERERRGRSPPDIRPPPCFRPSSSSRQRSRTAADAARPGGAAGNGQGPRPSRTISGGLIDMTPGAISPGMMECARGVRIAHVQNQALRAFCHS